ncbi:26S rRNA (cytosine-C(5))-methyltransferase nsun-1 [Panulirus ornatus]|uniref:26S rRNA (cytosine-C(5))-methyltransferase nsun-1 n=1 Tax=Panulirus ornatus TaxID=150431 RepID=UPI003A873FFB
MGRKADFQNKVKKGPGRKARKQNGPVFKYPQEDEGEKKLSRRQKVRARKRALKQDTKASKPAKKLKTAPAREEDELNSEGEYQDSSEKMPEAKELKTKELFLQQPQTKTKFALFENDDDSDREEENSGDSADENESEDDDDDSDGDIEKASKKLEKKEKAKIAAGDAYLEETAANIGIQIPSLEEVEKELDGTPDLASINCRIKDTAFVLADFKNRHEEGRSRSEYMTIFLKDLSTYYSYNSFLMEKFLNMFGPAELIEFLEASELPRPVTIRTNTLKMRRKILATNMIARGIDVDVIPWSKVGLVVMRTPGNVTVGATPEYLAGHYILQGASSFLPVMALAPKEGEKVLDMCAAPGGKSTHIAAIMRNTGMLVSNDLNRVRVKALIGNLHRMGITNSVISSHDGRALPKMIPNAFDRVLLDAPCSGTGVISKDERVKMTKTAKDIQRCSHLQRELILAAIDSVHKFNGLNGYIVYSTCSIMVEENEAVIEYALKKRHVKLVPTGLDIGKPGYTKFREYRFHPSMVLCKRIYPHINNMDGFFIAKLKKIDGLKTTVAVQDKEKVDELTTTVGVQNEEES